MARTRRSRTTVPAPLGDPTDPRGFDALLARFLEHARVHHRPEGTLRSMAYALRDFGRFCVVRSILRPGEVSRDLLERYQRDLFYRRRQNGAPLRVTTQKLRLQMVRGFFRYLTRERYLDTNPAAELELPKKPLRLPTEVYSLAEVEAILASIPLDSAKGLRDRTILETLYATGMRRAELVGLDLYDLDLERRWVSIRGGKGGKDRVVPLGQRASLWVGRYLAAARPVLVLHADERAVFLSATGQRFDPPTLTNLVHKLLAASGVRRREGGCCHLFRHTMATHMLERGADLRVIQEILGHASLETTEIYTRVSIARLEAVHAATHPTATVHPRPAPTELAACLAAVDDDETNGAAAHDLV